MLLKDFSVLFNMALWSNSDFKDNWEMFSKQATKIDKIFTVDLTVTTYCQLDGKDFFNFCGLLRKRELYQRKLQ